MKKGLFLPEELLEFPDEVVHPADDREEGFFAREVDARGLDLLDRVVAAAALEEAFVALEGTFNPFVDPAVKLEGGGKTRRILIDVERRVVKVRNVAPDEGLVDLLGDVDAVVVLVELHHDARKDFVVDRLALFLEARGFELVLGKEGLPVEGRGDLVEFLLEEGDLVLFGEGPALEKVVEEVVLVEGRGNLSHEDGVVLLHDGLRFHREEGVGAVPGFVGQGEGVF